MVPQATPRFCPYALPTPTPLSHLHPRLRELVDELSPELTGRGFTLWPGHALWARNLPAGLETIVLSFSPDDAAGGWTEPFVGLIAEPVEALLAGVLSAPATHGLRHTLLVGSTRWSGASLARQPVHEGSDVLEASNAILRWVARARPDLAEDFFGRRQICGGVARAEHIALPRLDTLFNTDDPLAARYLTHELNRALRGLALASLLRPAELLATLDFHRYRMQDSGFWEVYGDRVLRFAAGFQEVP